MVSFYPFTALFLTFGDLDIAVQTKSAGADKKLERRPPKSSDSEVEELADEEIVEPELPFESDSRDRLDDWISPKFEISSQYP